MKQKSLLPRGMRGQHAEGGMDPAVPSPMKGDGALAGAPQCPSPSAESSHQASATNRLIPPATGNATADSSFVMGNEPGAGAQTTTAPGFTHRICGQCNEVLAGDPLTVGKPGASVDCSGLCSDCGGVTAPYRGPEFAKTFLHSAATRHLEMARKLHAIGDHGLAEMEEEAARRVTQEANTL